jgi:serine palmitoyltransferase
VLDRVEAITIPSHAASPNIHIHLRSATPSSAATLKVQNPRTSAPSDPPLCGHELVEARPSIRLAVTAAKECERTAGVIKAAVTNVLAKRI